MQMQTHIHKEPFYVTENIGVINRHAFISVIFPEKKISLTFLELNQAPKKNTGDKVTKPHVVK